ncbi:hypothetical protein BV25DRAFT_70479 [Artomyces pyxidatus]|uniref:Uncharacterized protein n=1 Tax=Artomyces pyxidatus TaxID=48021 RepID=A0ACB8TKJ5_9AGAM|nr:hypothetical protein BV25DRAFT_70479 [Artomyces pyxidatus]
MHVRRRHLVLSCNVLSSATHAHFLTFPHPHHPRRALQTRLASPRSLLLAVLPPQKALVDTSVRQSLSRIPYQLISSLSHPSLRIPDAPTHDAADLVPLLPPVACAPAVIHFPLVFSASRRRLFASLTLAASFFHFPRTPCVRERHLQRAPRAPS